MKVELPKKYLPCLQLVVDSGIYPDKMTGLTNFFERGIRETLADLELEEGFPAVPALHPSSLEGPFVEVDIPAKEEYAEQLGHIGQRCAMSLPETAATVLLYGLCCHRADLKQSGRFEADAYFRKQLDAIPPCPEERVPALAYSQEDVED